MDGFFKDGREFCFFVDSLVVQLYAIVSICQFKLTIIPGGKMSVLPELVIKAWDDRQGPIVLTTVGEDGLPNSIYASCVSLYGGVNTTRTGRD